MTGPLVGFTFPFRVEGGRVARSADFDKIADNVRHALSTRLGERVMLRAYGGGVHHRLQAPNDGTLRALIKHEIEQALREHLPAVVLTSPIRLVSREEELRVIVEYVADPRAEARRLELQIA
jgi:phage baseplate assembly protein W